MKLRSTNKGGSFFNERLIINYGKCTSNNSTITINYPITFTKYCSVVGTPGINIDSNTSFFRFPFNVTTSNFTVRPYTNAVVTWIAIGF